MRGKLYNFLLGRRIFKKEFKKQLRLLIIITLGFTIAFSWRQTIFDISTEFIGFLTNIKDSSLLSIVSSIFITLMSILLIYLTSHFLKEEDY